MKIRVFKEKCAECNSAANPKIHTTRSSPNFSGDSLEPGASPNFFFCGEEHKKKWVQNMKELNRISLPHLAELDESMNYCEWFERIKGNEGVYKREGFEWKVNGLWDYKSQLCKGYNEFKNAYIKHFGNFNRFKLHNRYEK